MLGTYMNIFEQIGFGKKEAKELLLRSEMMLLLQKKLDNLDISEQTREDIEKGRISKFTASELEKLLGEDDAS